MVVEVSFNYVTVQPKNSPPFKTLRFYRISTLFYLLITISGFFVKQIKDWRELDKIVNRSLKDFKHQWRERSLQRRSQSDWAATDVFSKGEEKRKTGIKEEALFPGSVMKLALGERFRSVDVYLRNIGNSRMHPSSRSEWQQRLCKVLVDVCMPEGNTNVNPVAIMETPNHLSYMKLEVRGNRTLVGNILEWREIGFVVEIKGRKNEVIKKHFAINLQSKRSRRSVTTKSIPAEDDFPDYKQHDCCGCISGCSPVAWAQVFGYFDRRARYIPDFFSPTLYGDKYIVAPLSLTDDVKRFVEDIREQVETFCDNGGGATKDSKMHYISTWFRARQGSRSRVASYVKSRKKRSARRNGGSLERRGSSWIESKAVYYLNYGYPVILSITLEGGGGHSVVATKYKQRSRSERECNTRTTGFWWGKTKLDCHWKTVSYYEFYLHYGWGGYNNKWQEVGVNAAHCAYIS